MHCTACRCPGAYELLRDVICWNRNCRNHHSDVVEGSDFSKDNKRVNGDSVEGLKQFLDDVGAERPDELSVDGKK